MAQVPLAPPPQGKDPIQDRWLYLMWKRISSAGQILWNYLDFSGSNLTDLATRNHADLQNINTASYTHLTSTQATDLTDAGDSALHFHATDRARANHTGAQTASTISDFQATVSANADVTANTAARHDAATVADTSSVNLSITGQQISADVLPSGVDHSLFGNLNSTSYTHLTAANHTDLTDAGDSTLHYHAADRDRANHTGTQTAATISDFDTEVSNNTDVAANTSARHSAVTVADTASVDLTLTGQQVSAAVLPAGVDHAALGNLNSATYSHLTAAQLTDLTDGGETTLHSHPGGSGVPSNVISSNTTIAADTSYVVLGYLTVNAELTVNGNLGII